MSTIDLFKLRSSFALHDVLTCFNGPFSHGLIDELGTALRYHLERRAVERSAILDVFAVYIELAQNVSNYVRKKGFLPGLPHAPDRAIIAILWDGERFAVAAGNVTMRDDAAELERRILELNGLDKDALRARYKQQRRAPRSPDSPGAGLGLLDIARRAAAPVLATRTPIDGSWEFFSIVVRI
jgi:hypothetical protein